MDGNAGPPFIDLVSLAAASIDLVGEMFGGFAEGPFSSLERRATVTRHARYTVSDTGDSNVWLSGEQRRRLWRRSAFPYFREAQTIPVQRESEISHLI